VSRTKKCDKSGRIRLHTHPGHGQEIKKEVKENHGWAVLQKSEAWEYWANFSYVYLPVWHTCDKKNMQTWLSKGCSHILLHHMWPYECEIFGKDWQQWEYFQYMAAQLKTYRPNETLRQFKTLNLDTADITEYV
jgi:hypothetical protein